MNNIIAQRIKEARLEREFTQQDLANHLGKTAAAISEIERGKVQVSANDLYQISQFLDKPIEYFYGEDFSGSDIQDLIAIVRKMPPDTRDQQLGAIKMFLQMQDIGNSLDSDTSEDEQLELAQRFYSILVPFSIQMNQWNSQLNELRKNFEDLLDIKNDKEP